MSVTVKAGDTAYVGVTARDWNGTLQTGKTAGDFTYSLKYGAAWASLTDATESVSFTEADATDLPGFYEFSFVPANAGVYALDVRPTFTGNDGAVVQEQIRATEDFTLDSTYATTDQVKAYLGGYTGVTADDTIIGSLLERATDFIDRYCGTEFFNETLTEYPRGRGGTWLVLSRRPISSVTSVHVSVDLPRAYTDTNLLAEDDDFTVDYNAGALNLAGGVWPTAPRTIKVVYVAGPATVPPAINWACLKIAAIWLRRRTNVGLSSESLGEGSITKYEDMPQDVKAILDGHASGGMFC